jgi:uncharacterized protein (DUF1330 family)
MRLLIASGFAALALASAAHAQAPAAPGASPAAAPAPSLPAFIVYEEKVNDPAGYAAYLKAAGKAGGDFGGQPLVFGGKLEGVEGDAPLPRIVILRFPSLEKAKGWYNSPAYQEAAKLRKASTTSKVYIVEGLPPRP